MKYGFNSINYDPLYKKGWFRLGQIFDKMKKIKYASICFCIAMAISYDWFNTSYLEIGETAYFQHCMKYDNFLIM